MPTAAHETWLARAARLYPTRIAVDAPDGVLTYAELDAEASALAAGEAGSDARVPIELGPGAAFAIAVHAAWARGAVPVPIDPRLPPEARAARLERCVVTDDPADLATVLWTSGSTGAGTERRITKDALLWNALGSAAALGQPPHERWLSAMPVAHVGGFTVLTRSVIGGTTAVLRPRFDVEDQLGILMRGEATITSMVPTMLRRLLEAGLDHPPALRLVLLGGAPITADLTERAAAAGVPIAQTYGLTETSSQALTNGVPLFCTRVVLRGELPGSGGDGADDELLVRGPTLALGVANGDGWLETGDRGRREPDGTLSIVGRLAETIITGGENVAPTEVEAQLLAQHGIADAAVLGVEDAEWGEAIEARVVLESGAVLDEAALRAALRAVLPPFAVPKRITVVDALPRTPTGKLLRRALR